MDSLTLHICHVVLYAGGGRKMDQVYGALWYSLREIPSLIGISAKNTNRIERMKQT